MPLPGFCRQTRESLCVASSAWLSQRCQKIVNDAARSGGTRPTSLMLMSSQRLCPRSRSFSVRSPELIQRDGSRSRAPSWSRRAWLRALVLMTWRRPVTTRRSCRWRCASCGHGAQEPPAPDPGGGRGEHEHHHARGGGDDTMYAGCMYEGGEGVAGSTWSPAIGRMLADQ